MRYRVHWSINGDIGSFEFQDDKTYRWRWVAKVKAFVLRRVIGHQSPFYTRRFWVMRDDP